ncbi:MAG: hypothetical protein GY699_01890 [Desulfobacteraceae bacterium]|nr:hypothetical protein [Desulfobacteraceae bacterium]
MPDLARGEHRATRHRIEEPDINGNPNWVEIRYPQRIANIADFTTRLANIDRFPNDEFI